MCSVLLFLPLAWVDLGPLQHLRQSPLCQKSTTAMSSIHISIYMYVYPYAFTLYIYNFFICCLAALMPNLGQCLGDSLTNPILITSFFFNSCYAPRITVLSFSNVWILLAVSYSMITQLILIYIVNFAVLNKILMKNVSYDQTGFVLI